MVCRLCRIADKMLLKAKDDELEGDQELAYVLYMRFMDLYQTISSSKKDRAEMQKLIPRSKVCFILNIVVHLNCVEVDMQWRAYSSSLLLAVLQVKVALIKADELSKSLKERYLELLEGPKESDKVQHSRREEGLDKGRDGTSEAGSKSAGVGEVRMCCRCVIL